MKAPIRFLAILLVFAFARFADAQKPVENKDLPNFIKINQNFCRGAQPTESGVKEPAKIGVKTIVDLPDKDEQVESEEIWAQNAGMKFIKRQFG